MALYAPAEDFELTVQTILFLRNCHPQSFLIKQFTSFHIFFDVQFFPKTIPRNFENVEKDFFCPTNDQLSNSSHEETFKAVNKLTYPVNVGRNFAREAALTFFILASDIELYPNPGLVEDFLDMIQTSPKKYDQSTK